jgi:topoisomerase IA-like protein
MVDALWISVEGLRHEELKSDPSLDTLHKHLVAALLQAEQYQQLAIEINEQIMAKTSNRPAKKAPRKKVVAKKTVKKKTVKKKTVIRKAPPTNELDQAHPLPTKTWMCLI